MHAMKRLGWNVDCGRFAWVALLLAAMAGQIGRCWGQPELWLGDFGATQGWEVGRHPRFLADVNGDGLQDVVGFGNRGVLVALSRGDAFDTAQMWANSFGVNKGWMHDRHPRLVDDIDGDGKADIVGFADKGVRVSFSTGDRFEPAALVVENFGFKSGWRVGRHPRFLADVNGDGKDDIVGFGNNGVLVSLASDDGTFGEVAMWVKNFGAKRGWRQDDHPRLLGDVDGDGKADVVGFGANGVIVSLSTGSSFAEPVLHVRNFGAKAGWRTDRHPRFLSDVNRDGFQDVVGFGNGGVFVALSQGGGAFSEASKWIGDFGWTQG